MNANFRLGLVAKIILFIFSTVASISSVSADQINLLRPLKTLCAAVDHSGQPFVVVDFEVKKSSGVGAIGDRYANVFGEENYPVRDYRLISAAGHRFRIGTQIIELAYSPGQYVAFLSIYEETPGKLVQRAFEIKALDSLTNMYSFGYEIANSEVRVSCQINAMGNQAANDKKNTSRKPAKTNAKVLPKVIKK